MAVRDGIRGAGFDAVTAKNAAVVIDVVDLGIALGAGNSLFGGVFGGLNVDAIRWARSGAQETGYAFFQAVFIPLQHMPAAVALFKLRSAHRSRAIRIVLHLGRLEDFSEGDTHSFGNGCEIAHNRHI